MKGSELCGPISDRMCELLMCTMDRKKCSGCGEPAADGTKCGEDKVVMITIKYYNMELIQKRYSSGAIEVNVLRLGEDQRQ